MRQPSNLQRREALSQMGAELVEPSLGVSSENQAADSYRTDLSGLSDLSSILALGNKGEAPLRQRSQAKYPKFRLA